MKPSYDDILDLIEKDPKWHDQFGVPRFCDFHPEKSSNIYAKEVILLLIRCQNCSKTFFVEMNASHEIHEKNTLEYRAKNWTAYKFIPIHYGDPPRHDCVGDTMNSEPIEIKEFWKREKIDWIRQPHLEINFE